MLNPKQFTNAFSAAGIIFQAITKVLKHANLKKNGLKHIPPKTRKSDKNDYKYYGKTVKIRKKSENFNEFTVNNTEKK